MGAFYVSMIFLGILLVIGSLFFIALDRANGKDFFKEFDRKKDEMFNLVQEAEEMIQELNKMSDYVVTMISEKNREFFEKAYTPSNPVMVKVAPEIPVIKAPQPGMLEKQEQKSAGKNQTVVKTSNKGIPKEEATAAKDVTQFSQSIPSKNINLKEKETDTEKAQEKVNNTDEDIENLSERAINTQMSAIKERLNETEITKSRLVLNSKRQEVLKMIEQGLSNDEIADRLKIGKGEIGLIRGLSK